MDGTQFEFPVGWIIGKYDEWAFYRNQFSRARSDLKALDLLAVDPGHTLWLIEVKDYRWPEAHMPAILPHIVADKVVDTLAAILPAKVNAVVDAEKLLAKKAARANKMRVVLHVELPAHHSKLFVPDTVCADIQQKLRKLVKAIDPHPLVLNGSRMQGVEWSVIHE